MAEERRAEEPRAEKAPEAPVPKKKKKKKRSRLGRLLLFFALALGVAAGQSWQNLVKI